MYKQKIGISVEKRPDLSISETLQTIKNVGFDAISPGWQSYSELLEIVKIAGSLGLELQSLHAPFRKVADMWSRDTT